METQKSSRHPQTDGKVCVVYSPPRPRVCQRLNETLIKLKTFTCLFRCSNVTESRPRPHAPVQKLAGAARCPPPPGRGTPGPVRLTASLEGCPCSRAGFPMGGTRSHGTEQVPSRDHRTGEREAGVWPGAVCAFGPHWISWEGCSVGKFMSARLDIGEDSFCLAFPSGGG